MTTIEKPGMILRVGPNGAKESFITLQNVIKTYVTPAGSFQALRGIDLQIRKGEFMAVVGKSGSGKSTLLNMLTGIDRPTSGEVIAGQTAIHQLNEGQTARWRGRNVGIVFQFFQLLPTLTIVENIMLAMDFCKVFPVGERKLRALELLSQVGIAEQAYKLPAMLSGGEQQRVAIARALANDPPVLVADEPTGNLDTETATAVFQLLRSQSAAGKTVIIVTHDRDLAAQVNRTITLVDGRIIQERSHE
ncbi:MAG: ABC transporter ATP-binding protein [Chloroflexota bacterium]|nr:ABC transporter ATP-binding protein [Anaerolineales bacterium]